MIKFSFWTRVVRYFQRRLFAILFSKQFKLFGEKVAIISPDMIEGEQFISLENGVSFNSNVWLLAMKVDEHTPSLVVKEGSTIGRFAHIVAVRQVVIESNVLIADKVYISDNVHEFEDTAKPVIEQKVVFKGQVSIGEGSWVGENVSIIGARIGKHCVVGANAVVTRDIPDYSVVVGAPAKVIKAYSLTQKKWITV